MSNSCILLTYDILTKMVTAYIIHRVKCHVKVLTCDLTGSLLPRVFMFITATIILCRVQESQHKRNGKNIKTNSYYMNAKDSKPKN